MITNIVFWCYMSYMALSATALILLGIFDRGADKPTRAAGLVLAAVVWCYVGWLWSNRKYFPMRSKGK